MNRIEEILGFWFGETAPAKWFNGGEQFNEEVERRFGAEVELAQAGKLHHWVSSPRGRLALIILLDQFTRNIFDGPRVFESDEKALTLALDGIEHHEDEKLQPLERVFFYMPFQHSENLDRQVQGVRLYTALAEKAGPETKTALINSLDYMKRHHAIIQRFGRFPHRNAALERASTPEEIEFLKQPGSSF